MTYRLRHPKTSNSQGSLRGASSRIYSILLPTLEDPRIDCVIDHVLRGETANNTLQFGHRSGHTADLNPAYMPNDLDANIKLSAQMMLINDELEPSVHVTIKDLNTMEKTSGWHVHVDVTKPQFGILAKWNRKRVDTDDRGRYANVRIVDYDTATGRWRDLRIVKVYEDDAFGDLTDAPRATDPEDKPRQTQPRRPVSNVADIDRETGLIDEAYRRDLTASMWSYVAAVEQHVTSPAITQTPDVPYQALYALYPEAIALMKLLMKRVDDVSADMFDIDKGEYVSALPGTLVVVPARMLRMRWGGRYLSMTAHEALTLASWGLFQPYRDFSVYISERAASTIGPYTERFTRRVWVCMPDEIEATRFKTKITRNGKPVDGYYDIPKWSDNRHIPKMFKRVTTASPEFLTSKRMAGNGVLSPMFNFYEEGIARP